MIEIGQKYHSERGKKFMVVGIDGDSIRCEMLTGKTPGRRFWDNRGHITRYCVEVGSVRAKRLGIELV